MGLRFLEQLGTSNVGGFEGYLAKMPFDLLSGLLDTAFDLIEFVEGGIEGKLEMEATGGGITVGGGNDFALDGAVMWKVGGRHGRRFLNGGKNQEGRILFLPFPRYPKLPKLNTTI